MTSIRVRRAAVVPADALVPRLSPDERDRLGRAAPGDRNPVASALLLARLAVAEACGVDPGAVRVRRRCPRCGSAAHGVPVGDLADGSPAPQLSMSRAPGLVAVAVSHAGPVGIDVERIRPDAVGVEGAGPDGVGAGRPPSGAGGVGAGRRPSGAGGVGAGRRRAGADGLGHVVLAPGEPPAAGPHGLLRSWTRTEAVLKAAGTGLAVDPRALRVSDDDGRPALLVVDPAARPALDAAPGLRWWLTDLDLGAREPGATHVGALAALVPVGTGPRVDHRAVDLARHAG